MLGFTALLFEGDSKLVLSQLAGTNKVRKVHLQAYLQQAQAIIAAPRWLPPHSDILASMVSGGCMEHVDVAAGYTAPILASVPLPVNATVL